MNWINKDTLEASKEVKEVCRKAVKETIQADRVDEVESITIKGDKGEVLITGKENVLKFMERFSK